MSKFWQDVMRVIIAAILLAVLKQGWETYQTSRDTKREVKELREDVDKLYAIVSEDIQNR